jgi:hypothetical protein
MAQRSDVMGSTNTVWEHIIQLAGAVISLVGVSLTLLRRLLLGRQKDGSPVAGHCAGNTILTPRAIFEDIDSRPLAQRRVTATQYRGTNIMREPLWLYDVAEDPDAGAFRLALAADAKYRGPGKPRRTVVCAVARTSYPELIGAKKGLKIYVSGKVQEVDDQQMALADASLVFSGGLTQL